MILTVFMLFSYVLPNEHLFAGKSPPDSPATNILWHWEDDFNYEEKEMLRTWLEEVTSGVEATLGMYPFDLNFHMFRRNGAREPVPWARTIRFSGQGVDFHIDPSHSLLSFLEDWTAPHEISHLSVPFLGSSNAWFAEGYASFMQYQVMKKMGILNETQVLERYKVKLANAMPHFQGEQDMVSIAMELKKRHRYPEMYWGSASFFIYLDETLKNRYGISLPDLIKKYQACCRLEDETIEDVVASWDRLLGITACTDLLETYRTVPASKVAEGQFTPE